MDLGDWAVGATGEGWADNFNGAIDQVAIYSTALSPYRVAAHYLTGKDGTTALTVASAGGHNVTITSPAAPFCSNPRPLMERLRTCPGHPCPP